MLLSLSDVPTAVLCFSDVVAFGVIETARELGFAVPDDLSVVGFDDTSAARRSTPPLTTVRQDVAAKGRAAASELTKAIARARSVAGRANGSPARARRVVLPTELVVRESTARPRGHAGRRTRR
jgi:DNA-binding LacI/PurR family transcriptional regulator